MHLHRLDGATVVKQIPVEQGQPVKLSHGKNSILLIYYYCVVGDTLMLGSSTYLRFNHPQEAMKLKESSLVRLRLFIKMYNNLLFCCIVGVSTT